MAVFHDSQEPVADRLARMLEAALSRVDFLREQIVLRERNPARQEPVAGKDYIPFGMVEKAVYDKVEAERDEALAKVKRLAHEGDEQHDTYEASLKRVAGERDVALENHKQAYDVAMEMQDRMEHACELLNRSPRDVRDIDEAIDLLTLASDASVDEAVEEVETGAVLRKAVRPVTNLQDKLDEALERATAMARQRAALREIAQCPEGVELEERVRELVAVEPEVGARVFPPAVWQELCRKVGCEEGQGFHQRLSVLLEQAAAPKASDNVVSLAAYTTLKEQVDRHAEEKQSLIDERNRCLERLDKVFELVGGCPDNMEFELELALRKGREAIEEVQRLSERPKVYGDVVARSGFEAMQARAESAEKARDEALAANTKMAKSMDQAATLIDQYVVRTIPLGTKRDELREAQAILVRED